MKVLSYAWYIYDENLKQHVKDCTGGGLVVRDLCEYIGRKHDSYLFLGQHLFPEIKIGNFTVIKTDYDKEKTKKRGLDIEYLEYMTEIFKQAVEKIKPDIIHFHDNGDLAVNIINKICIPQKLTYAMTDHLYIGNNPCFNGYDSRFQAEKIMMQLENLNLVTVSTGEKKKILKDFPDFPENRITPLLNGTSFSAEIIDNDYKKRLGIGERKVLLCAGTLCDRKNQIQLLEAYEKSELLKNNTFLILCGNAGTNLQTFFEKIFEKSLNRYMAYVGAVDSRCMKKLYSIADGLVLPSYAEGLSISALEAISYGVPVIMFKDSECADDLNDENVIEFAKNRSDEELCMSIERWYKKEWNRDYILEYSKNFTMEKMAERYISFYEEII